MGPYSRPSAGKPTRPGHTFCGKPLPVMVVSMSAPYSTSTGSSASSTTFQNSASMASRLACSQGADIEWLLGFSKLSVECKTTVSFTTQGQARILRMSAWAGKHGCHQAHVDDVSAQVHGQHTMPGCTCWITAAALHSHMQGQHSKYCQCIPSWQRLGPQRSSS